MLTILAALRAAAIVVDACSGVVAAANEPSDARQGQPSQARQANQGRDSQIRLHIVASAIY